MERSAFVFDSSFNKCDETFLLEVILVLFQYERDHAIGRFLNVEFRF